MYQFFQVCNSCALIGDARYNHLKHLRLFHAKCTIEFVVMAFIVPLPKKKARQPTPLRDKRLVLQAEEGCKNITGDRDYSFNVVNRLFRNFVHSTGLRFIIQWATICTLVLQIRVLLHVI